MDDAPKPEDPETIAAKKICEEMRAIASQLSVNRVNEGG